MTTLVSIEAREFDAFGGVLLAASEQPPDRITRRITQSAVLSDTGIAVYDGGFFEAERELELEFDGITASQDAALRRMIRDHAHDHCDGEHGEHTDEHLDHAVST